MYGLRDDIDLHFLIGRTLIQVGIGLYQIIFRFDEEVAISVTGEFSFHDEHSVWVWRPEPGSYAHAARTASLLGKSIQDLECNSNGTLTLRFSNDSHLTLLDNSDEFESYDITRPGQTIVV